MVKWACAGPGVTRKEEEPLGREEGAELVGLWREDDREREMEFVGRKSATTAMEHKRNKAGAVYGPLGCLKGFELYKDGKL